MNELLHREKLRGCCQKFVCGIPCPAPFDKSGVALGFGLPVALVSVSWAIMGIAIAVVTVKQGDYRAFFICNRTLPYFVVSFALLSQGLDTASSLDGAVSPIGVGMSLLLNGLFLAAPINRMGLLTLPDLFRRKYGALMEVMVSFIEIASFTVLLAGNLVGISVLLQFCFGLSRGTGVAVSGAVLAVYTASGGLYSVALTDVPQALGGLSGLFVTAVYMLATSDGPVVPPPSRGFAVDLGGNVTARTPGYSGPADCLDPATGTRLCDNNYYPRGELVIVPGAMRNPDAYAPAPNALLYNWASIFVLAFGNLCALDFQARSIACKSPRAARAANLTAGCLLLLLALPFGLLGGLARRHYGPDSPYATFEPDSCSADRGRPSCAQWLPQENVAVFMMLWEQAPRAMGVWAMVAMAAASVSTADGAILATATVAAHNLWRKVPRIGSNERNLLLMARLFIVPMTLLACMTALLVYRPAYLLVVSFDIVLAGVLVPLIAAIYVPGVSPNAGLLSCLVGSLLRITLEQVLPKDGSLVAPLGRTSKAYGRAVQGLPAFLKVDPPEFTQAAGLWDPSSGTCQQAPLADWTGLDSLLSPACSLLTLLGVMAAERRWPGMDLLWFVPKAWRQASPLYLSDEPSVHAGKQLGPSPSPASETRPYFRRSMAALMMPSVPEEDGSVMAGSSARGGRHSVASAVAVARVMDPEHPVLNRALDAIPDPDPDPEAGELDLDLELAGLMAASDGPTATVARLSDGGGSGSGCSADSRAGEEARAGRGGSDRGGGRGTGRAPAVASVRITMSGALPEPQDRPAPEAPEGRRRWAGGKT
ncbi:hypothetical protein GPECTOR_43g883 [Gonium pectorale]|uniref:Uncharacterized protein n=1 Tax=Gonium pectorale TaxID=33097 RepID=A0A150G9C3_GONPE|nr:hypothetical protein GPECTOR_43g883 [Gonium pectorale]|eukprot:KXZ46447.1 hypothetical protein GPECTOR_43g883 [Gonium pectorale]